MIQRIGWMCVLAMVAMAGIPVAEEAPNPSFTCKSYGRAFTCTAANVEQFTLLPEWKWHHKTRPYRSYGGHFHYMAKKEPVMLEMRVYLDDQSEAPYDGVIYKQARVWVRLCGTKAKFGRYVEGAEPPPCSTK